MPKKKAEKTKQEIRKEELIHLFDDFDIGKKTIALNLIGEMVYLEDEIEKVKKLPFLRIHPERPDLQKSTPASRLYHTYVTEYLNIVRILVTMSKKGDDELESPLRSFLNKLDGMTVR